MQNTDMRLLLLAILVVLQTSGLLAQVVHPSPVEVIKGTFTDSRDNQTYKWVKIGKQIWMAQNLNYNAPNSCWCYEELAEKSRVYGRLYSWDVAMVVCPKGWHLPSDSEWDELKLFIKKVYPTTVGTSLKAIQGWDFYGNGTDIFGFAALPGGYRNNDDAFNLGGNSGFWWSSTSKDDNYSWARHLKFNYPFLNKFRGNKKFGFAIRCIKD
jgi:uncharacterized protein (TIGR02145 family)